MASALAHLLNFIFRRMPVIEDTAKERAQNASRRPPRPPKGVTVGSEAYGGIPCETVRKAGNGDTKVMYIHGGGFTTGSARERRAVTFYLCDKLGYDCIACDYRLAPEHKLPAAQEDCFAAYRAVVARFPRLIVMGESAGGTLALTAVQRALREGLPAPPAVAAFSPAAGIGLRFPSHSRNVHTDYMLKRDPSSPELLAKMCPDGCGEAFYKDPSVSPYYGSFAGFPPLFLAASDIETLYDDAAALQKKAAEAGVRCTLTVKRGVVHAYPVITQLRETRETFAEMQHFFRREGVLCGN